MKKQPTQERKRRKPVGDVHEGTNWGLGSIREMRDKNRPLRLNVEGPMGGGPAFPIR